MDPGVIMRHQFRKYLKHSLQAILLTAISIYLGYHFIQGENGVIAWLKIAQQIENSNTELVKLTKERKALEHRVKLMRPETLDPDLLEERIRAVLNYGLQNDRIIVKNGDSFAE